MSSDPIVYLIQAEIDASEFKEFSHLTTEGWYFWDESGAAAYGPYESREKAADEIKRYCKEVLGCEPT